jgi:hypothetical protein
MSYDFSGTPVTRKARKSHRCTTCYRRIEVGESYQYATGKFDDRWHEFRMCVHCEAIWHFYRPEDMDGLISEDGYDSWAQNGCSDKKPAFSQTTQLRHRVQFRNHWRRADGSLYPVPS